ncbi:MAG: hypothetical protein QUU85_14135, partial [Candidatus Eisenbacteria bacterium]|nr:hypothetical protein [Candidatus Eisenbacteria bacterium]
MPSGALLRAASVLPLERRGIVRSLYAWFFAAGMLTWLFLVALILLSSWMHGGRSSLGAIDGESAAPTLLGLLALVPAAAAGSLAQAVGARTATAIAGGLMILGLAAMMVLSSASRPSKVGAADSPSIAPSE